MGRASKKGVIEDTRNELKKLGTYKPAFEPVIEMLADVMHQRKQVYAEFRKSGGKAVVTYVNKNGSENMVKNPLLVMWDDLTNTALRYYRELGLTPSGLKKLDGAALKQKKGSALGQVLKDLGG